MVTYSKSSGRQTRRKREEPEPEKDVDFFVDNVERENANAVKLLNASRGSKLVKSALGDLGSGGAVTNIASAGKIKDQPLGKHEPWGLSFGHFPFRSWPKPKS